MDFSILARFAAKIQQDSDCWLWTAGRHNLGYGNFALRSERGWRMVYAHRWAYEQFVGPIPEGMVLDHLCRMRHCVNPDHLEPVSNRENILRGEGQSAKFARSTHCHRGHARTGENVYVSPAGHRLCRVCRLEYGDVYRAARRAVT